MDNMTCFPDYDVRTPLLPTVGPKIRTPHKTWELHGRTLASGVLSPVFDPHFYRENNNKTPANSGLKDGSSDP